MSNKYIALTIGPIHQTLKSVKSTKAIWSASYLFSYLMRETIKNLKNTEGVSFLVPFVDKVKLSDGTEVDFYDDEPRGVGLFPDRFMAEIKGEIDLNGILKLVITDITGKVANNKYKKDDVAQYLQNYFQLHALEVKADFENPVESLNEYLNTLECQTSFVKEETVAYLIEFCESIPYNNFIQTEFAKKERRFPSSSEIATADLGLMNDSQVYANAVQTFRKIDSNKAEEKAQELFYDDLLRDLDRHQRHKYIAIVQADGDNMGSFIGKVNDAFKDKLSSERFKHISHQLLAFAYEATKLIEKYGGKPIYAGGDDLLFFAPVVGGDNLNVLLLFKQIDDLFEKLILKDVTLKPIVELCDKKPSMSYGVSMSYYKFPLNEALEIALSKLFNDAKNTDTKNAVSFSVLKHSGQTFGATFHKSQPSFDKFMKLVQNHLGAANRQENFINSIGHKIQVHEGILRGISTMSDFPDLLKNFFVNNFNEPIHKAHQSYIDDVRLFVEAVFTDFKDKDVKDILEKIYAALRYVHFVKAPFKNDD